MMSSKNMQSHEPRETINEKDQDMTILEDGLINISELRGWTPLLTEAHDRHERFIE